MIQPRFRPSCLGIVAAATLVSASSFGDTLTWRNNTSNYNVASSWENTNVVGQDRVPIFTDLADFSGVGTEILW
jgi:hypothetical protein